MMRISYIFRCGADLSWMDTDFDFYVQQKKQYLKNKNEINYIHYITAYEGLLSDCKMALSCGDIDMEQFDALLNRISGVAVPEHGERICQKNISSVIGPPSNLSQSASEYADMN